MSCYILPDSLVHDIEAACARFWWGTSADSKKVHWKKWADLCRPKSEGGLGFRNLAHFNQALLGKQVWRLIQRPHSLLSRVFKAKYFHSSTIWHASANSKASYVWKSILWGRNLVAKGIRWRVGNGRSISVYNSRWIPTPHSFMVSSPRTLPADSLGLYSVKSAYKLAFSADCVQEATSSSSQTSTLWNFLWQLSIPPKVKIFWWRALHNIIPTSWNLKVHHVPADLKCSLCGSGIETTVHSLFLCPKMKLLWKTCGMMDCLSTATIDTIKGNELRWIPEYISSFKACRATMHHLPSSPQPRCWTAPIPGHLRLDVDAAFDANLKCYGLGAVIRDSAGRLMVAGVWPGQQASSIGMAELMAVRAAKLEHSDIPANEDGIVIIDIQQLALLLNVVSFNSFSRICNGVAHCLARHALHRLSSEFWFDDFQPSWLVSVLLADSFAS
ncbi:hypothetical protein UlMin_022610 [Ulmus minor]